jgi:hypothetical protein
MLSEKKKRKRKMWSEKWKMERNVPCDAHLLNGLLETDVEDYINYLRNRGNCGIFCVNCAVLCVKDDWKGQF